MYEIAATFTKIAHFGQLGAAHARESLRLAYQLDVQLIPPDEEQALKAYAWTERLQRAAAYDSFYLALAETLGCELWTVDKRLVNAVAQPCTYEKSKQCLLQFSISFCVQSNSKVLSWGKLLRIGECTGTTGGAKQCGVGLSLRQWAYDYQCTGL